MKKTTPRLTLLTSALSLGCLLVNVQPLMAATIWVGTYDVLGATTGSTLWKLDTGSGTLTEAANFTDGYNLSLADSGQWLYGTWWNGSAYELRKLDRLTFTVEQSVTVASLGANSGRFGGMTWDGLDLWGMDANGDSWKLTLDPSGDVTGSTPGINMFAGGTSATGTTGNTQNGTLTFDPVTGRYIGGVEADQYVFSTSDLQSGPNVEVSRYNGFDQFGDSVFDDEGNWWLAEWFQNPTGQPAGSKQIYLGDPDADNAYVATFDFTVQLDAKGHEGYGALALFVEDESPVVPEPGTLLILALGGVLFVRRLRRSN